MNTHSNRSWILILVLVCVMLQMPMAGHAFRS
jgi:hypothetical protein